MRPHGSAQQLEQRRRRAVALRQEGWGLSRIAGQVNATPQAVGQWLAAYARQGPAGLCAKPVPGRPPKLSARQRRGLVARLLKGAQASGFATDLWTCPRIAQVIQACYGVHYHVDHIPRLMRGLGFSPSASRASGPGT